MRSDRIVSALLILIIVVVAASILRPIWWSADNGSAANAAGAPADGGSSRPAGPGGGGGGGGGPGAVPAGAQTPAGAQAPAAGTAVRVQPVGLDTIRTTVRTNGDVVVDNAVNVMSNVAGRITTAPPPVGTRVAQGEHLAMVDPSRPGEAFSLSPVISPVAGTITARGASLGDTVTTQTPLVTVSDLSQQEVRTWIPERHIGMLRTGLTADVTFEAFPGETFPARVTRIAPVVDPAGRTLEIVLRFTRHDSRIRPGMYASIELVTRERRDVITVPRSAILETWQERYVYVVDSEGIARRRTVQVGLEGNTLIEITEGLELEEALVVRGQNFLAEGAPVRVIGESL